MTCRIVGSHEELALHFAIREAVFVKEQAIFEGTDRDNHDQDPATVHVIGMFGRVAGGAVRLYPLVEPHLWKGDRLAVLPAFRNEGLGAPLVRFAVHTAARRSGKLMIAYIQPSNVRFFERLGWFRQGDLVQYAGRPHQKMAIELGRFAGGSSV